MPASVVVHDLWEEFRLIKDRPKSVKELISRPRLGRKAGTFVALRGVDLSVVRGETLGLIGENGSGKSTLLRCIAGIIPPTRGDVLVAGPVSSLIELGAGFHPELSGRENVYVSGALFGLTRSQITSALGRIVEFAELEHLIDQPVRSYSSGMYVRLAFSLAVSVDPEILLIDEVLAVGDETFQRKCVARVDELKKANTTVVFVSHDMKLVKEICSRCVWIHDGVVKDEGDPSVVVGEYLAFEDARSAGSRTDEVSGPHGSPQSFPDR